MVSEPRSIPILGLSDVGPYIVLCTVQFGHAECVNNPTSYVGWRIGRFMWSWEKSSSYELVFRVELGSRFITSQEGFLIYESQTTYNVVVIIFFF